MMLYFAIVVALVAADPAPAAIAVQTLDGRSLSGELIALDGKQLTLRSEGNEQAIDVAQLLNVSRQDGKPQPAGSAAGSKVNIQLRDESLLAASEVTSSPTSMQIQLDSELQAEVPMQGVAWVRFPTPAADITAEWERIAKLDFKSDVIVVRTQQSLDYLEGIVRTIKGDVVEFELDGEVRPVKRAKVEGLIFFHPKKDELPSVICRVVGSGGLQLHAAQVKLDGSRLATKTPAGLRLDLPWDHVDRLDFSGGKVMFLSDLDWDPQLYERVTFFGGKQPVEAGLDLFPPQRDRAFDGGALELDRRSYAKGLSLHSRTRVVYRLPGDFRRFQATAGINSRNSSRGALKLVIEGDGRELFSAELTGSDPPAPLDLDIAGVKRLSILVDFGKDLSISDHLDLVEARILK